MPFHLFAKNEITNNSDSRRFIRIYFKVINELTEDDILTLKIDGISKSLQNQYLQLMQESGIQENIIPIGFQIEQNNSRFSGRILSFSEKRKKIASISQSSTLISQTESSSISSSSIIGRKLTLRERLQGVGRRTTTPLHFSQQINTIIDEENNVFDFPLSLQNLKSQIVPAIGDAMFRGREKSGKREFIEIANYFIDGSHETPRWSNISRQDMIESKLFKFPGHCIGCFPMTRSRKPLQICKSLSFSSIFFYRFLLFTFYFLLFIFIFIFIFYKENLLLFFLTLKKQVGQVFKSIIIIGREMEN